MITVKNAKGRTLTIPNAWEELTPAQYVRVAHLIMRLSSNELNLYDFRFALLRELTQFRLSGKKFTAQEVDVIYSNLAFLLEKITFALRYDGKSYRLNLAFRRNPLPQLRVGRKTFTGARFTIGGVVDTDISARRFCDAYDLLAACGRSPQENLLNILCAVLYGGQEGYSIGRAARLAEKYFCRLSVACRYAVFIWFSGVTGWLFAHPVYAALFAKSAGSAADAGERIRLGMGECIMQLSLSGFGSVDSIGAIPVTDFFDLMVKDLKHSLAKAVAGGAKKERLAQKTGLTYAQLSALISNS